MSFLWAGRRRPWTPCGRPGRCSRPAARTRRPCSRGGRSTRARISGRAGAGRRPGRRWERRRAAETTEATPLPKGVDGSIGLDSLDFIELSIAIEERFGIAMDENQDLTEHFASFDTLSRFIAGKLRSA